MKQIILFICIFLFSTILYAEEDYLKKAADYFNQGKLSLAEIFYKKALQQQPENYQANYNLAKIYYSNEDYNNALQFFQRAYDLKQDREIKFLIANCHAVNKNPQLAITLYSNLIKAYPDYADAYLNAGYVGYKLIYNKYITIANWEKFLEISPNDEQAPQIKKALEYLRDPNFVLQPPGTKTKPDSAASGGSSTTADTNLPKPFLLPEIKGKDLKTESEEKYETMKKKSIRTD